MPVSIVILIPATALLVLYALGTLRARWRVHRAVRGARELGHFRRVTLTEGTLVLSRISTPSVTLAGMTRVRMTLLEGDRGFADANSQTYLIVVDKNAEERLAFRKTWQGTSDWAQLEALRRELRALGLYEDGGEIAGVIGSALGPFMLGALMIVSLVIFAFVWRWERGWP